MDGSAESSSLADALFKLLEELCTLQHGRTVLSPQELMHAMNDYIPDFNLTSQQDAEEALSHLLSSLREELSDSYVPGCSSFADVTALPDYRVLGLKKSRQSERERWRQFFIGPFNGILCSSLTCQSCSFQISLDFQLFQTLHLLPVANSDGNIVGRCSVVDCLERFLVAEQLENYCCFRCWHIAAIKYASKMCEDQIVIEKLKLCHELDSCNCKNMSCLREMPCPNRFWRTFKQYSVAHSPQILCIHLQRASVNAFGEIVKLQGHISFPLVLDMAPFTKTQVGTKTRGEGGKQICPAKQQSAQQHFPLPNASNLQHVKDMPNGIVRKPETLSSYAKDGGESGEEEKHIYSLVSVVEHFGRVGSGHYIVYRRVAPSISRDNHTGSSQEQWYCISDSQVDVVSEKEVLDAEASLLFYEKVYAL
ncbi:unnamed protein product [Cuscuta campestris]|uniref:ubiquitinyl hydrolase 1 n=1 Tax=Cuscuta campestris TaxID=132261 RepID=A0A484N4M4_9ASTE|nr:unnamed protein product [Cuscuta campestris]